MASPSMLVPNSDFQKALEEFSSRFVARRGLRTTKQAPKEATPLLGLLIELGVGIIAPLNRAVSRLIITRFGSRKVPSNSQYSMSGYGWLPGSLIVVKWLLGGQEKAVLDRLRSCADSRCRMVLDAP